MLAYLLAICTIVATTVSQAMMKHGMARVGGVSVSDGHLLDSIHKILTEPFIIGGLLLVALVVPLWLVVLERLPLSVAYPMVSFGYVLAVVIGALVFKETITPLRITGVTLTVVGVSFIAASR